MFSHQPPLLGSGGTTIPKDSDWVLVSSCAIRGYGILADGSLWGWGAAPLGDGTTNSSPFAKKIGSDRWKYVSTSESHTLAIKEDGSLWSWGSNKDGSLGIGNKSPDAWDNQLSIEARAFLNGSIASIDSRKYPITRRIIHEDSAESLQPTSVTIEKSTVSDPGIGASISCEFFYSVTQLQLNYFIANITAPPVIEFQPDSRDANAEPAVATVTVYEDEGEKYFSFTIASISFGGRYKYKPTIKLRYTQVGASEQTVTVGQQFFRMEMTSTEYNVTVLSSGSGYSHPQSKPILIKVNFLYTAFQNYLETINVTVGMAVLSPASVARIERYYWTGLQYPTGRVTIQQTYFPVLPGGTYRAYLASPTDPTVQLNTSVVYGANVITATELLGRKSSGYIVIENDEVFQPDPTQYPSSTDGLYQKEFRETQYYGPTTDRVSHMILVGNEPDSVLSSGKWSVLDSIYGTSRTGFDANSSFAPSHSILRLNTPSEETYQDYSISTVEKGGVTFAGYAYFGGGLYVVGGLGAYSGGKPHLPLYITATYGWGQAQYNRLYTEHKVAVRNPKMVTFYDLDHNAHRPPASPVQPTFIIEARDGVGSGLAVAAVFDPVASGTDVANYTMNFNVTNPGSGYVYEPYIAASLYTLSPTRVGSDSDWESVKAIGAVGSAGVKSDGWPMVWGTGLNESYSPQKLGFSLDIKSLSAEKDKQWLGSGYTQLPGSARSKLVADTLGGYPTDPRTSDGQMFGGQYYYVVAGFNSLNMLRGCPILGGNVNVGIFSYRSVMQSRCWGLSNGIYAATAPADSATRALFPPRSWYNNYGNAYGNMYRVFMPQPPEDDLFKPLKIPSLVEVDNYYTSPTKTRTGSCYTKAPDLGSDYSCTLVAPDRIKSFSYSNGNLYGLDGNNDLWFLRGSTSDGLIISIEEPKKETLKGLKLNADVSWEWSVEEYDCDVYYQSYDNGSTRSQAESGQPVVPVFPFLKTIQQNRLSAPERKVEPERDNGYTNTIEVITNCDWSIVVTNPGSGYKINDTLNFTIKSPQGVRVDRTNTFDLDSVTTQDFKVETLDINYTGIGYYGPVPNLKATWGSTDPWKPKPYKNQLSVGVYKDNVTSEKVTNTVQVIKEAKWKLVEEFKPTLVDYNDVPLPSIMTVADGGAYRPAFGTITNATIFGRGPVAGLDNATIYNSTGFLTKIPDVAVSGGSGSGCTAKLVPATGIKSAGTYIRNAPYNVTAAVTKNRGSIKDADPKYAISSSDGSLISLANPLVSVPDSYRKGFDSLSSYFARTADGDFYAFGGSYNDYGGANSGPIEMRRPTAQMNLELTIDNAGEDYQLPPVFTVPQPSSEIAVVDAVIDGKLIALGVEHAGSGYRYPPTLTIVGGEGSGATAEAVISGPVDAFTVSGGGSGYAAVPFATLTGNGSGGSASVSMKGSVARIEVSDGGSNYSAAPFVTISGDGTGAAATATMKQMVSQILITSRSGRYKSVPTVAISGGGGTGASAEAEALFNASEGTYYISGIRIKDKGEKYTSTPTITISSETNASVSAYAVMDKYVESVEVTSGGVGYSTPPTVLLAGTASASAFLTLNVDSLSVSSGGTYRSPPSVSFDSIYTVESISLDDPGSGYLTAPDVRIICPRGVGSGATAKCQIKSDGTIKKIVLTSRGSGYIESAPPVVLFFGGGGYGASATANIDALGGGASATTTINGSILFARAVQGGSNYQFSPTVQITGGGNTALADLQTQLANGSITSDQYEDQFLAIGGRIRARIEGPISRLNIVNAGDKYVKVGTQSYTEYSTDNVVSPVDLNGVMARAYCFGVVGSGPNGWYGEIDFEAPDSYPGGPISQPASLPTAKFNQKPQIQFVNSVAIHPESYHACTRTAIGMSSVLTRGGPVGNDYYYSLEFLECVINSGLTINGGKISRYWTSGTDYQYTVASGFDGFAFDETPLITFGGACGTGAAIESSVDGEGRITGTYFTSTGSGYSVNSSLSMSRGVIRITPCTATCTVSATGQVTAVSITSPGSGYINPAVVIHGGGGSGATATAMRMNSPNSSGQLPVTGGIASVAITSGGSGYYADNPPQVFIYDSTGYFSDSTFGKAISTEIGNVLNRVVKWSSESSEHCPAIPHEYRNEQPFGPWFDISDRYTNNYLQGYPDGRQFQRFPIVSSRKYVLDYHEYFRGFGYADYVSNLFISSNPFLLRKPYSSPPTVTVQGSCKTQMQVSSAVAKWGPKYSVSGAVVSAIRTDR